MVVSYKLQVISYASTNNFFIPNLSDSVIASQDYQRDTENEDSNHKGYYVTSANEIQKYTEVSESGGIKRRSTHLNQANEGYYVTSANKKYRCPGIK